MSGLNGSANGHLDEYQRHALDVARGLARCGVPIFSAPPDPTRAVGFALPRGWDQTDTTHSFRALELWRPGMALCAVMGSTLDLIDFDPHNGTPDPNEFTAWPSPYATAATPSGGYHAFVASLRVGSRDAILPGVDVKGGRPDGTGRGFAFIAPTVRVSKVDGTPRAYAWTAEPDWTALASLAEGTHVDTTGAALAEFVAGRLSSSSTTRTAAARSWNSPSQEVAIFRAPARTFTYDEAIEFCRPAMERLMRAPDGARNASLNEAAKTLSHFGEEFWPFDEAAGWLLRALPAKEPGTGRRAWDPMQTIASAYRSAAGDWRAERVEHASFPAPPAVSGPAGREPVRGEIELLDERIVDIGPYLDGTYEAPQPVRGVVREGDGKAMLYPGAWHTVVGPTGAGKSWFALANARDEMLTHKSVVVYCHFEEASPAPTIARLLALGIERDVIRERFRWLDCTRVWRENEFAWVLSRIGATATLIVLDGIIAACTKHQQDPLSVQAVGWYRDTFVTPATREGAAVLSLGHPPKASHRQGERHSYGSTAWLDEVDGVGFRLLASQSEPIRKTATGYSRLYSTKDRHGSVEQLGRAGGDDGWTYLGTLAVDNSTDPAGGVRIGLLMPKVGDIESGGDAVDVLAEEIVRVLERRPDRAYERQEDIETWLNQARITFPKANLGKALDRLDGDGRLERDPSPPRRGMARGGHLATQNSDTQDVQ